MIQPCIITRRQLAVLSEIRQCPGKKYLSRTKIYPTQFDDPGQAIKMPLGEIRREYIDLMLLHHPGDGDVECIRLMEQYGGRWENKVHWTFQLYIESWKSSCRRYQLCLQSSQNEIHPYYQETEVIPYIQNLWHCG